MQRLDLFTSGVQVPKLGSRLDVLSRAFLTRKTNKDVSFAKLLAYTAANNADSKAREDITRIWSEYLDQSYYQESTLKRVEANMLAEYEKVKDLRLSATVSKNGIVVKVPEDL